MSRCQLTVAGMLALSSLAAAADHKPVVSGGAHAEHTVVLALCDATEATHQAIADGDWADPKTWAEGVPTPGARVYIPECFEVTLRTQLSAAIEWLRIDGTLHFAGDKDTGLRVATVLVSGTGTLTMGAAHDRIRPERTAALTFVPRAANYRAADPYDLTGGLIALGQVQIHGSVKRAFAVPKEPLRAGTRVLTFVDAPIGWQAGDEMLVPATADGGRDEMRRIESIADGGRTIVLSAALECDHVPPAAITSGVPVGNLTRNVTISSAEPGAIAHRGHVMFMAHEGIAVSGALFRGLGRTRTERIHTVPERDRDGRIDAGDNPIGRYAVHYHLRSGARVDNPPLMFTGNAIVDSPKHGLANHGAHVVAENNVTYAIHGSHFFAENGSEVGAFRNNLTVYSKGSGDRIRARECLYDFGHGGHGFWAQSPAVVIADNFAFHHADAAYSIFARPVYEFGKPIKFATANLPGALRKTTSGEFVSPGAVPFRFERNVAGHCGKGLEIWNTNTYAKHNVPSIVDRCQFWGTPHAGIDMPYTFNTIVRATTLIGRPDERYRVAGIHVNNSTRFLTLEKVSVSGFEVGIEVPVRGHTLVADCHFDNAINIRVTSPVQPGRRTVLRDNVFVRDNPRDIDYFLADPDCRANGDVSILFDRDVLLVEDARFPEQTVYFNQQLPQIEPLPGTEIAQLRGRAARTIWAEHGLAIAGSLAPAGAAPLPRIRGVVGPVSDDIRRGLADTERVTFQDDLAQYTAAGDEYTIDQNLDRVRFVKGRPGEESGWRLHTKRDGERASTRLVYVDTTAPHFELLPCMKLQIHPDDVKHGIEVCGILTDEVAGKPTMKNMIKEFKDLQVDPDGFVTVHYCCADSVGNTTEHTYRFEVTADAPRRGKNIGYYNQKAYLPPEESSVIATPLPRRATYWWWLGGGVAGMLLLAAGFWIMRARHG